jgi:hypothetical protein
VLEKMRAPPDPPDPRLGRREEDSGSDDEEEKSDPVGAFPGTEHDYQSGSYY